MILPIVQVAAKAGATYAFNEIKRDVPFYLAAYVVHTVIDDVVDKIQPVFGTVVDTAAEVIEEAEDVLEEASDLIDDIFSAIYDWFM